MRSSLLAVLVACGGGSGGNPALDCAYLASANNCWKTVAADAASCLPSGSAVGVLSADNMSCTYATGQVVTFTTALTLPLPEHPQWDFTVTANGAQCMKYQEGSDGLELWNGCSETVSESDTGTLDLTCPDGTTYSNANPLMLLSCPGSDFGGLPGNTTSSSPTSVSFTLLNTSSGSLPVFNCSR
jgi:hypothetical protein